MIKDKLVIDEVKATSLDTECVLRNGDWFCILIIGGWIRLILKKGHYSK